MAIGLDPITLAEASPIMAEAMDLSWPEDKSKIIGYVNKYRNLLYTLYNDFKLFDNIFHCICVSQFDGYRGITLPNDVLSAEAVYAYGQPLTLRSRWQESHVGIQPRGFKYESIEMAEQFPTERDLITPSRLKVFTEHDDDAGKLLYVEAIDIDGKFVKVCFKLVGNGFTVSRQKIRKILSVSLPVGRKGAVTLAQIDGFELSIYDPWETVPAYRRLKLPEHCKSYSVILQGTKKFRKIYFDHDIVEVGDALVIESAAKYFKYGDKGTDTKEINRSNKDLQDMGNFLRGLMARHRGGSLQDASPFTGRPITKNSNLYKNR